MSTVREVGFYWVRNRNGWMPAEWEGEGWWVIGCEEEWADGVFLEIGPRLEPPK